VRAGISDDTSGVPVNLRRPLRLRRPLQTRNRIPFVLNRQAARVDRFHFVDAFNAS
jgi:hypothetical protein